jgi:hypothetical protein
MPFSSLPLHFTAELPRNWGRQGNYSPKASVPGVQLDSVVDRLYLFTTSRSRHPPHPTRTHSLPPLSRPIWINSQAAWTRRSNECTLPTTPIPSQHPQSHLSWFDALEELVDNKNLGEGAPGRGRRWCVRLPLRSGVGSSWKNQQWEWRCRGIGRGSNGGVRKAQQLSGVRVGHCIESH